ncbi:MAG: ATP-binding protein [Patescibacteria group bacterium]|nr:cell wall metabolism sensor histidine kinase WalK [Patescibacteria group bacterium]
MKKRKQIEKKLSSSKKLVAKEVKEERLALLNMLEDIDEARKIVEEEKEKTEAIITNFTDGLLFFDKKGKLSLINLQASSFFKVKSEEVIGKSILELTKIPNLLPLVELLGKEIKGIFRKEIEIRENLVLEVNTIPTMKAEEKIGNLVILHDITRERIIERIKTEFVSLAAHQLRTPLSAIKWTMKMLLEGDLGPITDEQREFINKTYQSNERMIELINDLLDVARIEEGKYLYKPVFTNIEPIVKFVINSFKQEIEDRKIKLEFKKSFGVLPKAKVDIEKIRLVIQNLLENAVKYTKPGGDVTVSLKQIKDKIEFSIKDTGVGISQDQQKRIFTKFFRAANVVRMETDGSGLGLFIAKNIVEAHGGRIWFESEEEKGTTFYFNLPIKEEFGEFLKEF